MSSDSEDGRAAMSRQNHHDPRSSFLAESENRYGDIYATDNSHVIQGDIICHLNLGLGEPERCHQILKTSDYESHKTSIPKRAPQTCRWVLDHPDFRWWQQTSRNSLLWISAYPGCGKSVLARSLIDGDLPNYQNLSICYFFFKSGMQEQDTLASALCAILHQLFVSQPHLRCHVVAEWQKSGDRIQQEIAALRRVLRNATADSTARPTTCIIDGFDECRRQDQQLLLDLIAEVCSLTSNDTSRRPLKFLVTSRPCDHVQRLLGPLLQCTGTAWLRDEMVRDKLHQEIDLVIGQEIDQLAAEFSLTPDYRNSLRNAVTRMEQRTYLWWNIVRHGMWRIYQESWSPNEVSVRELLSKQPRSLDDAYEELLRKLTKEVEVQARLLFSILLGALRPLTIDEMARILEQVLPVRLIDEKHLEKQLLTWCGLMVFVHHSKLSLLHCTARDFLLRPSGPSGRRKSIAPEWKNSISLHTAHKTMAIACQKLLRNTTEHRVNTFRDKTVLHYANQFVCFHTAEAIRLLDTDRNACFVQQIDSFGMNLQVVDAQGMSLLHHLIVYGSPRTNYGAIDAILRRGGLVQAADRRNMHCLQYAVLQDDKQLILLLLRNGFQIDTAIQRAGVDHWSDRKTTKVQETDRTVVASHGLTALHAAALFGRPSALDLLIHRGANVLMVDQHGRTALHAAVGVSLPGRRNLDAWDDSEWMAEHKWDFDDEADCNRVDNTARMLRLCIVWMLCRSSANLVGLQDNKGRTALHLVKYGDSNACVVPIAAILLSHGGDQRAQDSGGVTPIHLAAKDAQVECLRLFVPPKTSVHDFGAVDNEGRTSLHYAAMAASERGVQYILAQSRTAHLIDAVDFLGQDPLQIALFDKAAPTRVASARIGIVRTLLAAGAQASRVNDHGRDVLAHYLCNERWLVDVGVVQLLLEHGSNPFFHEEGVNLAHNLVRGNNETEVEALAVLQSFGVPVHATDHQKRNILHHAAIAGSVSRGMLVYLSSCLKLDPMAQDMHKKTPSAYAKERQQTRHHKYLFRPDRWKKSAVLLDDPANYGSCCQYRAAAAAIGHQNV